MFLIDNFILIFLVLVLVFVPGTGETMHLLHKNHLYYKLGMTSSYRRVKAKCNAKINVDENEVITSGTAKHSDDCELTQCQIDVKLEIKQMKLNAKSQVDVAPKTIYTNSRTVLTEKGHNLEDLKQANFPHYNKCRGTINKWRSMTRAKLPKKLI
jgi:hypothetical protein